MTDSCRLMDETLALGREELDLLREGNVDAAADIASRREKAMNEAFASMDDSSRTANADKLNEIRKQLDAIVDEARKLKGSLQNELGKVRNTSRQFKGYSAGAGYVQSSQGLYHRRG